MRLIDADALEKRFEYLATVGNDLVHKVTEEEKGMRTAYHLAKYETHVAPTISPESLQPQWITVAERLPEEKQRVCILLENGNVFRAEIRTRQLLKEWWYRYDPTDEDMDMLGIHYEVEGWLKENPIVAWMPLSEPYTSAGEEAEHGTTE